MKKLLNPLIFFSCCIVVLTTNTTHGQYKFNLLAEVSGRSRDGVQFTVRALKEKYLLGDEVVLRYRVVNGSSRTIHLAWNNRAEPEIRNGRISFNPPYPDTSGHAPYDFRFETLGPHKSTHGTLRVLTRSDWRSDTWEIEVGFGYVFDIRSLRPKPEEIKDPLYFNHLLDTRIRGLTLGSLTVELENE